MKRFGAVASVFVVFSAVLAMAGTVSQPKAEFPSAKIVGPSGSALPAAKAFLEPTYRDPAEASRAAGMGA